MNRKIKNPYAKLRKEEEYQCFGCSPFNERGLQLSFQECGKNKIETYWEPKSYYEGFFKILHGGIQATLQDEIAGWLIFSKCKTSGVTQSMNIRYLKPAYITDEKFRITARLIKQEEKKAIVKTELLNQKGEICSEAEVVYFLFTEEIAKRKHQYPGVETFFDE
jgi:uncharacterized protein (TIGR00369 family)